MGYRYNPFTGELDRVDSGTIDPSIPTQFDTDSGSAVPSANIINFLGDATQGISSSGAGNTVTYTIDDATTSQKGVVDLATNAEAIAGSITTNTVINPGSLQAKIGTQTNRSLPFATGATNAISWTSGLTDGQIVIGSSGGNPAAANITSLSGTITISNGNNTINLEVDETVATSYTTDSGSAVPASAILQVLGGTGCGTTGATNVVTINLDATVPLSFPTDSGSATPAANALTVSGGTGCSTAGAAATVTINLDGEVATVYHTDSGDATPSANAITVAGGTLLNTAGSGSTLTINADDAVVGSVLTDSGTVTPASNAFSIVATGGITTSGATSIVTIDGSGISSFEWVVETGTTHNIAVNTGVFCNNGAGVTVTLPATAAVGDTFKVVAMDAAGWVIAQQTGQTIQMGDIATTTTTGTITSTAIGDWIELVCNVANTDFMAYFSQGGEVTLT